MSKPSYLKHVPALLALLAIFIAMPAFAADALVKAVPVPDLSKLPPAKAAEARDARTEFEKAKPSLVGDALAQAHAQLGSAYARAGLYDAAAVALEDASVLAPGDARWLYAEGIVARLQQQNAAALGYFERALTLDKNYLPIRLAVVNSHVENGDLEGARKVLGEYLATNPKQAVAYAMEGDVALREKRYSDAIESTKHALVLDPQATKLYEQLANAYTGAGNASAAADARAKAGAGVPALGDPILIGLLQSTAAQSEADAATPDDPQAAAALRTMTPARAAEFLLTTRQYNAARAKLDSALRTRPNDAELLAIYARVEAADGDLPEAKSRAEAAVAANPQAGAAQFVHGVVLEMINDDRGAQEAYEKTIALEPSSAEPQLSLGNLLMRNGRYDDAATRYRALTKSQPTNIEAWSRLVAAEAAAGKCAAAITEINAALAKDAHNGILMQLFVRLTSTCTTSSTEEKRMALDYGREIYRDSSAAPIGEAFALALAANGKWDDAVKTQQAAMFVLMRNGHRDELPAYRDFLQQFQAHKVPARPWAPMSGLLKPERAGPDPKESAPSTPVK